MRLRNPSDVALEVAGRRCQLRATIGIGCLWAQFLRQWLDRKMPLLPNTLMLVLRTSGRSAGAMSRESRSRLMAIVLWFGDVLFLMRPKAVVNLAAAS